MPRRRMSTYFKTKLAFGAVGLGLIIAIGGGAYLPTGDPRLALGTMVATAIALATLGRHEFRKWYERHVFGEEDRNTEPTWEYAATTRGRTLAPKIRRMMRRTTAPVTIIVVGLEELPGRRGHCRWTEALRDAATAGATVHQYLMPPLTSDDARHRAASAPAGTSASTRPTAGTFHPCASARTASKRPAR